MLRIRLSLAISLIACSTSERTEEHQPIILATADTISLESCARLDRGAIPVDSSIFFPDQPLPPVRRGEWDDIKRIKADRFTIDVPDVASVVRRKSDGAYFINDFPGCRGNCDITIVLKSESGSRSLDDYIATLALWDTLKRRAPIDGRPIPPQ